MEEWALNLMGPLLEFIFPEGHNIEIPKQDPPDCIVTNGSKSHPVEFTAFDTWKVFEFYNSGFKKKEEPFYTILQIPYEPEQWIMSVMERKPYVLEDKFSDLILVTHFHGGLDFQNSKPIDLINKTSAIGLTNDLIHRMRWALCNSEYKDVDTFLVHPEHDPIQLNVPVDEPCDLDVSGGYPTIQTLIGKFPLNKEIDFSTMERLDVKFSPKTDSWTEPDSLRGDQIAPFIIHAEPKDTDALAMAFGVPDMPVYNQLDIKNIAEAEKA